MITSKYTCSRLSTYTHFSHNTQLMKRKTMINTHTHTNTYAHTSQPIHASYINPADEACNYYKLKLLSAIRTRISRAIFVQWHWWVFFRSRREVRAKRTISAYKRTLVRRHMHIWYAATRDKRQWHRRAHAHMCRCIRRMRACTMGEVLRAWADVCTHGAFLRSLVIRDEHKHKRIHIREWARITAYHVAARELECATEKRNVTRVLTMWRARMIGNGQVRGTPPIQPYASSVQMRAVAHGNVEDITDTGSQGVVPEISEEDWAHAGQTDTFALQSWRYTVQGSSSLNGSMNDATPRPHHRVQFSARNAALCVLQNLHDISSHDAYSDSAQSASARLDSDTGVSIQQRRRWSPSTSALAIETTGMQDISLSGSARETPYIQDDGGEHAFQVQPPSAYRLRKIVRAKFASLVESVIHSFDQRLVACLMNAWRAYAMRGRTTRYWC
jgi:hypothetical protein